MKYTIRVLSLLTVTRLASAMTIELQKANLTAREEKEIQQLACRGKDEVPVGRVDAYYLFRKNAERLAGWVRCSPPAGYQVGGLVFARLVKCTREAQLWTCGTKVSGVSIPTAGGMQNILFHSVDLELGLRVLRFVTSSDSKSDLAEGELPATLQNVEYVRRLENRNLAIRVLPSGAEIELHEEAQPATFTVVGWTIVDY